MGLRSAASKPVGLTHPTSAQTNSAAGVIELQVSFLGSKQAAVLHRVKRSPCAAVKQCRLGHCMQTNCLKKRTLPIESRRRPMSGQVRKEHEVSKGPQGDLAFMIFPSRSA